MYLAFDKLSFAQVTKLHMRYKVFFEAWLSCQQENAEKFDMSEPGDASLSIIEIMGTSQGDTSKKDALYVHYLRLLRYRYLALLSATVALKVLIGWHESVFKCIIHAFIYL